jgi:hypothetical protein
MPDYLSLWAQDVLRRDSASLMSAVEVTGERNQHIGPRMEVAKVHVRVEPAAVFESVDFFRPSDELREELKAAEYPDYVIWGLLDVLMLALPPLKNSRVVLERVEYDPIHSSYMAFRDAARDAGRKILDVRSNLRIWSPLDGGGPG